MATILQWLSWLKLAVIIRVILPPMSIVALRPRRSSIQLGLHVKSRQIGHLAGFKPPKVMLSDTKIFHSLLQESLKLTPKSVMDCAGKNVNGVFWLNLIH